jgi:pilus assembly protein CpaB
MRTGTIVSLGASAVLGLGALIVARVWLPTAPAHAPAAKPTTAAVQTVPVVVATGPIPYGTRLDPSKLAIEQLPVGDAPQGAYANPNQLLQQPGGAPIVLTPLTARQPVLPAGLSGAGARPTVSAAIDDGMRAYTIAISDVAGVGGHVLPGDRVDVIVTRQPPTPNALKDVCGECKLERADVVLQDVKVLGVDLNADPTSTQSVVAHTATLEVTVQDAQRLSVAAQIGTMSLALRRTGQADITPVRTIEVGDVRSNAPAAPGPRFPDDLRLAGIVRHAHASGPSSTTQVPTSPVVPKGHSITVINGDAPTNFEVPQERFGAGA